MTTRRPYLEIFLLSLAVLLLEVSYTRIFSFKLVYFFTYLIIGISLLGLGAGGVLVSMLPRLRRAGLDVIPACCVVGALGVLLSYVAVALIQLNAFTLVDAISKSLHHVTLVEGGKLLAICFSLFVPYLAAGIGVAVIFATGASAINRLYFADLMGAGLACALAVPLMATISPPGCVFLGGAAIAFAGLRRASSGTRAVLVVLAVALLVGVVRPGLLPEPIPDMVKTMSPQKKTGTISFSKWSPVFRVDVGDGMFGTEDVKVLSHDGMWGSIMPKWDGKHESLSRYDKDVRSYPFRMLGPKARVAIIGSAGGNEILASLYYDAAAITAIELNPVTVSLLTTVFPQWIGDITRDPRVELVNAEGRSFLMSRKDRWDVIWFVAPDSYAAMNAATSGAYVLSESYLYTVEMITESLKHLTDRGIIVTQFGEGDFDHKPNRTARYLSTAREAFRRMGITDFDKHVLVSSAPGFVFTTSTILLKKAPFTPEEVAQFEAATKAYDGATVRHVPGGPDGQHPVDKVIDLPPDQLETYYEQHEYDLRPVTDDAPFFWHFMSFRNAIQPQPKVGLYNTEEGMGERLLVILLVVAAVLATLFLLAPLLLQWSLWRTIPYKPNAAIYFAGLGLGFMFLEVPLIQHLTLFLGYPTYSLTVTLFAILLSTGAGSFLSEYVRMPRRRFALLLGAALVVLVVLYQTALSPLLASGVGWPFPVRVGLAIVLLAPLGLCLGAFMPLGLRTVASLTPQSEAYVAWAWAVNGFCSVIASVLSTLLSMAFGFDTVMLIALVLYGVAIAALLRIPEVAAQSA
jgi:spermidine synthase